MSKEISAHAPSTREPARAIVARLRRLAALARPEPGYRRLSLYWRVLVVNATVLVVATLALVLTPATVSFPLGIEEAVILVAGLTAMVTANAALLRVTFGPLDRLVRMMRTIDLLKPSQRLRASGGTEVRQVIHTFNEMLDRLERERQASSRRAYTAQENERRRIGQELHDEIGQRLTGILLQLQKASSRGTPDLQAELAEAQELARSTLDEVGRIAWQLRPGILDDLGLARAIEELAADLDRRSQLRVETRIAATLPPLGSEAELVVYRVAQESLTNALRHSQAATVDVTLQPSGSGVRLRIADDGRGFVDGETDGWGIRGMRERALNVGADLVIESRSGVGVSIELAVPGEHERRR